MVAILVLALLAAIAGWYWVQGQPPAQRRGALLRLVLFGAGALVLLAALTGRLYLVLAILAGLLPLLKRLLPGLVLGRLLRGGIPGMSRGGARPRAGNHSRVATDIVEMQLDHDTGDMAGRVLQGPFAGRELADLGESEFIDLLNYCRGQDADSARLLESYLDRRFGDSWRADDPQAAEQGEQDPSPDTRAPMGEQEALEILGLQVGASREDIIRAHRQMMQKLHPDRGGSTYLAALVNQAKSILLDDR